MAPPIHRTRRPPVGRGRSAGDVLAGLFAVVALIALTVGVPFGLIKVFGMPIPHNMPGLSVLTHKLDIFTILKIVSFLVCRPRLVSPPLLSFPARTVPFPPFVHAPGAPHAVSAAAGPGSSAGGQQAIRD